MTGIEKILNEIETEGLSAAAAIRKEGDEKKRELLDAARKEAEARCEELRAQSEAESRALLERGASGADLLSRRMLLEAKQEILLQLFNKAKESIYSMEAAEYFDLLKRIISSRALPKKGEIILSQKDKERLPAEFEKELNALLPRSRKLTISEETREFRGGCVLLYGGVEENCSIEALFEAGKEEIIDHMQPILFREG